MQLSKYLLPNKVSVTLGNLLYQELRQHLNVTQRWLHPNKQSPVEVAEKVSMKHFLCLDIWPTLSGESGNHGAWRSCHCWQKEVAGTKRLPEML